MSESEKHLQELNERTVTMLSSLAERQGNMETLLRSLSQLVVDLHMQAKQARSAIQALAASRSQPIGKKIRCVFLVNSIEIWDALYDVYKAMLEDDHFDPIVATINRRLGGDAHFSGEQRASDGLTSLDIPHLRLEMEDSFAGLNILRGLAPDVIFRQSQWDNLYPPAFSSDCLSFAKLCVVPYGIIVLEKYTSNTGSGESSNELSCDTPYHRAAWRIFCENQYALEYFRSFHHSAPEKLVLSGYPKLQRLLDEPPAWPEFKADTAGDRPFRVIWAPHHTAGDPWLNFGVFHRICRDFLEWASKEPGIEFVLKPHPELFKSVVNRNILSQQTVDAFLQLWNGLPNCTCENGRYGSLFAASDLMITDGISFFVEYPIFGKPLVFFDSGLHAPLNEIGKMGVACADVVSDFDKMKEVVLGYKNKTMVDTHQDDRKRFMKALFPGDRLPSDIILDDIAAGLGVDRGA
ncbi:hypothetical protein K2X14_02220 [Acetobacter sp. TBRC 12305]|uniref:CDP-Glycerol:Poly(Glycerophosphate) glycerophosphotransferase n=1 Tax=Acetobacter garciniae TaxID=2817435 RepID=A0A939HLS8_9PROT|nr:hypothetical protein [Acetobacter garciniae]MBO1323969.1 hypothetical protein [Acetobacter garciniae]MBX0343658.1 hypothetical protein [Acetobacter garciniae]